MNLSTCQNLATTPESSWWYRAIQPQHWLTAINTSQTKSFASRFNGGPNATPSFEVLYLAQDQNVALFEVQALLGSPYGNYLPQPVRSWAIISVQVLLTNVVDLTDLAVQKTLETSAQELTGDWFGYAQRQHSISLAVPIGLSPTQELGARLSSVAGVEGFKTVSAKVPDKRILVVFPQKMRHGNRIIFKDQLHNREYTISNDDR